MSKQRTDSENTSSDKQMDQVTRRIETEILKNITNAKSSSGRMIIVVSSAMSAYNHSGVSQGQKTAGTSDIVSEAEILSQTYSSNSISIRLNVN